MIAWRCVFLSVLCCFAALPGEAADWLKLKSAHFELYTSQPPAVAQQAIERLETTHAAFVHLGSGPSEMREPLVVIVFSGYNEFGFYSPGHLVKAYFTQIRSQEFTQNAIVVSDFSKDVDPILYHEFAHYCSKQSAGRLPMWLEEGLASYYESLEFESNQLVVGKPIARHVKLLKSKNFTPLPFGDLFAMRNEDRRDHTWDESAALYAQGWATVHTLATVPKFAPSFGRFVALMRSGQPVHAVLESVYGTTIAQLRGEVDEHVRKLGKNEMAIDFAPPAHASRFDTVPIEPWESRLLLTNLLVNLGKPVEAERDFEVLTKEFSKTPQVWEALGDFKYSRGEKVLAMRNYRTAISLGSQNPVPLLRVANEEGSRSESVDKAFALLDESLRRHPANHGMRLQAMEWAFEHKRYDKAADWAGRFTDSSDVKDFELNFTAGYAHFRADRPQEAKQWLQRAIASTTDASEKQRASGVLDRVEIALERRRVAARVADGAGLATGLAEPSMVIPPGGSSPASAPGSPPNVAGATPEIDRSNDTVIDAERLSQTLTVFTRDRGGLVVEGTLHELRCLSAGAQLVILSGGKPMVFAIDEPGNILITRGGQHVANFDFRCGRQKAEKVHIGYAPASKAGVAGFLRILQFD